MIDFSQPWLSMKHNLFFNHKLFTQQSCLLENKSSLFKKFSITCLLNGILITEYHFITLLQAVVSSYHDLRMACGFFSIVSSLRSRNEESETFWKKKWFQVEYNFVMKIWQRENLCELSPFLYKLNFSRLHNLYCLLYCLTLNWKFTPKTKRVVTFFTLVCSQMSEFVSLWIYTETWKNLKQYRYVVFLCRLNNLIKRFQLTKYKRQHRIFSGIVTPPTFLKQFNKNVLGKYSLMKIADLVY